MKWSKENTDWGKVEIDANKLSTLLARLEKLPSNKKVYAKDIVKRVKDKGVRGINEQNYGVIRRVILPGINSRTITLENWYVTIQNSSRNSRIDLYMLFPNLIEAIEETLLEKEISNSETVTESFQPVAVNWRTGLTATASQSKSFLLQRKFLGLYKCYLHSPNENVILSYPLLLRENPHDKTLEVLLGNGNTKYRYSGIPIITGIDTLCFSVIDFHDNITEMMQMTLSIPHTHTAKSLLLRGTFSSIDPSRQPICGRIILRRISEPVPIETFENTSAETFGYDDKSIEPAIVYYLKDEIQSLIMCERTYHNLDGLVLEKNMIRDYFNSFNGFGERKEPSKNYAIYPRKKIDSNDGYSVQGFWISDFIGRAEHAIEIYYIKQSGSSITCMFQHFKKSSDNKNFRGKGVGFCKGNKITISYNLLNPKIMTNGAFILQAKDNYPVSILVGNFFEIDNDKIITSHSKKLTFRKVILEKDKEILLQQNETFIFKNYDEVATKFKIQPLQLSENEENNSNFIMDL